MIGVNIDDRYTKGFISEEVLATFDRNIKEAHGKIENRNGEGGEMLGWLDLPSDYDNDELTRIKDCAARIRRQAEVFLVVGIGGSYLGSRAVIEALSNTFYNIQDVGKRNAPQIIFVGNNLSSKYMSDLMDYIDNKEVYINVISKSGNTIEPAIAFRILKKYMEERYGPTGSAGRIVITTDRSEGSLKFISERNGYETFVIPNDVGGRYSVLTPVGLLPIAVAGIDIDELLDGALLAKELYSMDDIQNNDCYKYALIRNILYSKGKSIEVLSSYEPSFEYMGKWWQQLFGESEGKNGKGIFPACLNYTADLHSMGQLMQEGDRNVFETVISVGKQSHIQEIPEDKENLDGLNYIAGKDMDFVNDMAMEGVLKAHSDGNVPCIKINVPDLSEYSLGQLIFFFEKACAVSAYIMGVNPFNQPGVEKYKSNMIGLLRK